MNTAPGRDRGRPARRNAGTGRRSATTTNRSAPVGGGRGRSASPGYSDAGRRSRELSQNYLRSPEAAQQFLATVHLEPDGICVEVGAGEGILTARLAGLTGQVIAYEIDEAHAARLAARVGRRPNVRIIPGDFLAARPPRSPFQVVGNVPFSLTAPIIEWCLHARRMTVATLITQLEYARKRTGGYGRWSQLTVSTWPQFRWELCGRIDRADFRPVPRVDAGILRLERRAEPLVSPDRQAAYRRLVQAGFSGLGGSVQATLRRSYPPDKVAAACAEARVDRREVVGYVSPDQWVQIFRGLESTPARAGRAGAAERRTSGRGGLRSSGG